MPFSPLFFAFLSLLPFPLLLDLIRCPGHTNGTSTSDEAAAFRKLYVLIIRRGLVTKAVTRFNRFDMLSNSQCLVCLSSQTFCVAI